MDGLRLSRKMPIGSVLAPVAAIAIWFAPLTVVLLMVLVPLYWPMTGMPLFVGQRMQIRNFGFCVAVLLQAMLSAAEAPSATGYHVAGRYMVGGVAGWDYISLDAEARRLYVSHVTGLEVLDADSGRIVGHIADTPGLHGIALAPALGKGFVGNGDIGTVSVVDLKTLAHTAEIKVGKKPDAIVFDPGTRKVVVANAESNSITIIDAVASKAGATIDIGGAPEYIASDLKGTAWVNVADRDSLAVIDMKAERLRRVAPLPGCKEPTAIAIDRKKGRLFVGCRNKVLTIADSTSLKILASLPIGEHVDAVEFDADRGLVFASTGEGNLTIVREQARGRYAVLETVKTLRGAKTMAFDPRTRKIFLPTVEGAPEGATGPPKASGPGAYRAGPFVVLVVAPVVAPPAAAPATK
jgi:YVTN family beta-propeller protein